MSGKYLYSVLAGLNQVLAYKIGGGGTLSSLGTYTTGIRGCQDLAAGTNQYLYAPNDGATDISVYRITGTGLPSYVGNYGPTQANPRKIAIDPSNSYLYTYDALTPAVNSDGTIGAGVVLSIPSTLPNPRRMLIVRFPAP